MKNNQKNPWGKMHYPHAVLPSLPLLVSLFYQVASSWLICLARQFIVKISQALKLNKRTHALTCWWLYMARGHSPTAIGFNGKITFLNSVFSQVSELDNLELTCFSLLGFQFQIGEVTLIYWQNGLILTIFEVVVCHCKTCKLHLI